MKKLSVALIALAIIIAGAFWWVWEPNLDPIPANTQVSFDDKNIIKGAELATLANCINCHTASGKPNFSGGRALETPFGTIYASNLTPDRDTGIGTWSEEAFARAMRQGIDREGGQLYPAFPYDHFTLVTDEDMHSIYAYLMSNPPVSNPTPQNELEFPFNIRPIVAGWKLLFLNQDTFEPDPSQDVMWNRGRYLVEGLGHCGSCHTPRNAMGAEKEGSLYSGGIADGWVAPALNADLVKAHSWTVDELTEFLSTGWSQNHGVAAGPMSEVAHNLSRISQDEVRAMASYIVSLAGDAKPSKPAIVPKDKIPADEARVVIALYDGACARCHNSRNDVGPSQALPLNTNTAVHAASSANVVRAMMQGIEAYRLDGGPYMPSFGQMLDDEQIAALAKYVRARYSDQPQWTDVDTEIAQARQKGAQQ